MRAAVAAILSIVGFLSAAPGVAEGVQSVTPSAEAARLAAGNERPEFGVLHVADGVEATYYACTACHSEMIVAQQGLSRADWEKMLVWMVEEQGMSELEEPERTEILDYLSAHYNEDRPNFPR